MKKLFGNNLSSENSQKEPPVPMPNTVVKLLSAEDNAGFPCVKAGPC